ncbi:hypothetical protein DV737_g2622, partial [Chaetothyriales sp. CBS 132003]
MAGRRYSVRCQGWVNGLSGRRRCLRWTRIPLYVAMSSSTRCVYCTAVEGAIMQLNELVANEPWWQTEGRTGDPDYEQVEADRAEVVAALLNDLSAGREEEEERTYSGGLTVGLLEELRREGVHLRDRLVLSFIATAGQGLTEAEAYGREYKEGIRTFGGTGVCEAREAVL